MADDIVKIDTQAQLDFLRGAFEGRWAAKFKQVEDAHRLLQTKYQLALSRISELEETLKDLGVIVETATRAIDTILKPREDRP